MHPTESMSAIPAGTAKRVAGSLTFQARYGAGRRRPMQATPAPQNQ